jgi:Microfibril-associated/Pre-mRNA processing
MMRVHAVVEHRDVDLPIQLRTFKLNLDSVEDVEEVEKEKEEERNEGHHSSLSSQHVVVIETAREIDELDSIDEVEERADQIEMFSIEFVPKSERQGGKEMELRRVEALESKQRSLAQDERNQSGAIFEAAIEEAQRSAHGGAAEPELDEVALDADVDVRSEIAAWQQRELARLIRDKREAELRNDMLQSASAVDSLAKEKEKDALID